MRTPVEKPMARKVRYRVPQTLLLSILLALAGCDKQSSAATVQPARAKPIKFPDLSRLKGKAASGLSHDAAIGERIRDIVPVVSYSCMDDIFKYMRDLDITADGTLSSDADGSHVYGFRTGFFTLTPTGEMDIVLQCENGKTDHRFFQYFTTRAPTIPAPTPLMAWLRMQAMPGDELRRMDDSGVNDFEYAAIERTALTYVVKPVETQRAQAPKAPPVEEHYVVAGGVICTNTYDFYRVNAVERSGNPYAQLPVGCETLGANLRVNFIHSVNGYLQVGNEGGTAWVRPQDFR